MKPKRNQLRCLRLIGLLHLVKLIRDSDIWRLILDKSIILDNKVNRLDMTFLEYHNFPLPVILTNVIHYSLFGNADPSLDSLGLVGQFLTDKKC